MLRHDDNLEATAPPPSAAQVRVTPQELAAALVRLEARKDASQRHIDGTVPIGEAVQQLGLDATSEEVLAEVEADRARQKGRKTQWLSLRQRWGLALAAGAISLSLAGWWERTPHPSHPRNGSVTSPTTVPSATAAGNAIPDLTPRYLTIDPKILQVGTASGQLVLMSEVGDDQIFHTRLYGNRDWGDYFPDNATTTWTLIKHDGHVYLRGWVERMSVKLLQSRGADVTNRKEAGHVVPITLALEGFKVAPDGSSSESAEFNAEEIHLDNHAYEKWQP